MKIASGLINEYGCLTNLLSNVEKIKQKRRKESIIENSDKLALYRQLVTLDDQVPFDKITISPKYEGIKSLRMTYFDPNRLLDFCKRMELRSCKRQIQNRMKAIPAFKDAPTPAEFSNVPF